MALVNSTKRLKKKIGIIGFPMDLGADRRGVDMGPSALRYANVQQKLEKMGYTVKDFGDILIEGAETLQVKNPKLKYLPEIVRSSKILAKKVESLLNRNFFPLILGGDHASAIGSIAGISSWCRKNKKTLGVIWIDAHSDMNTPDTTPSGNIHGMPLAVSLGVGEKKLTGIGGFTPKVLPENTALIGIRDVDQLEAVTVKNYRNRGMQVYTMTDVDKQGVTRIIARVLNDFKKVVDHIHISFDLDGVDPDFAGGVGTPVEGGLTYREASVIMEMVADCGCMSSLEMLEVNPILDTKNETSELAVDFIESALGKSILFE
ncbi:MAG: arginase [Ignavibacteria bacterium]|nr:arginase [Ignavibacteria bacterium]